MDLRRSVIRSLCVAAFIVGEVSAHDGVNLEPPLSAPEAWNVITICRANMESLGAEQRWAEIGIQASLSIQALRFLRESLGPESPPGEGAQGIREIEQHALAIFYASQARRADETNLLLGKYAAKVRTLETGYDPKVVKALVFSCAMCRGIRELDPNTPCRKCGMKLEERPIPASDVYNTPGEPSIVITPRLDAPLTVGGSSEVTIGLSRKKDGKPVTLDDLRVVHTEPIHLLIIDESLSDYHHEHPRPTAVPGEYVFRITPRKPGPYRLFADLVPLLSRVQEYAVCDLPGSAPGEQLSDRAVTTITAAGDLRYELQWRADPSGLRAKEPVTAFVRVSDAARQPFRQLEPVMGAFAHIVGFYEDRETVLHIHPEGAEPQQPTERGGPTLKFRFYAPKPGFIRLYVQTQIGGAQSFAPFGVAVAQ